MESTWVQADPFIRPAPASPARSLSYLTAPVPPESAWEIEALLLRIFEYGDYSLRAALSGAYAPQLDCLFAVAHHAGVLVGAGGALCGQENPAVAILGPLGVQEDQRGCGLGTALATALIEALRRRGCERVYLGVTSGHRALPLYHRLGFVTYAGIVRRLSLGPPADWDAAYFAPCAQVEIRRAHWGDFPAVQALWCCPGALKTVDACRGIFSSRYVPPARFLSLFPELMKACHLQGGFANVLVTRPTRHVVGFASVCRQPGAAQRHLAQLEFYVHDHFLDRASHFVLATLLQAGCLGFSRLRCFVLASDHRKRVIVEGLDGTPIATVGDCARLGDKPEDMVVYEWNMEEAVCGTAG